MEYVSEIRENPGPSQFPTKSDEYGSHLPESDVDDMEGFVEDECGDAGMGGRTGTAVCP